MKAQQTFEQAYERFEQLGSNLARYWTVPVSVIVELGDYALVRRGDGLSFVVETKDLEHWPREH